MARQFQFTQPTTAVLDALIESQRDLPIYDGTLPHQKQPYSALKTPPRGYDFDKNKILLGSSDADWAAAKLAMDDWAMFPDGWAWLYHPNPKFTEGSIVVMCAKVFGLWWLNACRILTVEDSDNHYGFAYATLPNHVEMGEELFHIWREHNGNVYYGITAASRPRFWAVRLTYPLARIFQRKFVQHSLQKMYNTTHAKLKSA